MNTSVARMTVASVCAVSFAVGWPLTASASEAAPSQALANANAATERSVTQSWSFQAALSPFAGSTLRASGASWITVTGSRAEVKIQVKGLPEGTAHAQFLFVDGQGGCAAAPGAGDTSPRPTRGLGSLGVAMTTTGVTVPGPSPATMAFPKAAAYTYARTIDLTTAAVASIAKGTATLVVYGIDENRNGRYDGASSRTELGSGMPAEATAPALCGAYAPMQMAGVPDGAADTGGGSTADGNVSGGSVSGGSVSVGNVTGGHGIDLSNLLAGALSLLGLTHFVRRWFDARP